MIYIYIYISNSDVLVVALYSRDGIGGYCKFESMGYFMSFVIVKTWVFLNKIDPMDISLMMIKRLPNRWSNVYEFFRFPSIF